MQQPRPRQESKLVYLLPNLLTAVSLFLGILSILAAAKGDFEKAGWLIFASLIFDGLDGRVARMTGTTSRFGVEFDSLADLVAFGVAPAMLLYFSVGIDFGKYGTLAAGIFATFGAVRLARFNVQAPTGEPNVFIGLPIPAAAVLMVCWLLLMNENELLYEFRPLLLASAFGVALLMVSNIRYHSFKKIDLQKTNYIKVLIVLMLVFSVLYLYFLETLTVIMTVYALSGVIRATYNFIKIKTAFKKQN